MEVLEASARAEAGCPSPPERLAAAHWLPDPDADLRQMTINRGGRPVTDDEPISAEIVPNESVHGLCFAKTSSESLGETL